MRTTQREKASSEGFHGTFYKGSSGNHTNMTELILDLVKYKRIKSCRASPCL